MGRLIVIEGLDGSGKGTQCDRLTSTLLKLSSKKEQGGLTVPFQRIDLPDYDSDSSALVKMYLNGAFGQDPYAINPYAAGSFYAVDRYANFQTKWKACYEAGGLILANRYATANAVHQAVKLPRDQWADYIRWSEDMEYEKLGLPRPDLVLYLDMDPAVSQRLLMQRYDGDAGKKDIHEKDVAYLFAAREAALFAAKLLGWQVIPAFCGDTPIDRDEMEATIQTRVQEALNEFGLL